LSHVEIVDGDKTYTFPCERWLADDKDDKKIERMLFEKNYDEAHDTHLRRQSSMHGSRPGSKDHLNRSSSSLGGRPKSSAGRVDGHGALLDALPKNTELMTYQVTLSTERGKGAGTRAPVWVELMGAGGRSSGRALLVFDDDDGAFDAGTVKTFTIEAPALAKLHAIKVSMCRRE
jgi:hypothetical protein